MFQGLINNAKSAAGSLIGKYLARATVAVPFIVALGFATAAIAHMLFERFGAITAYWTVAALFGVIGIVAMLVVQGKEHEEEVAVHRAEQDDTAEVATDAAAQAAVQAPLALLGALLSTTLGPSTLATGAKAVARNIPLVVLLALIALLFWPTMPNSDTADIEDEEIPAGKPNGAHHSYSNGQHQVV